LSTIYVTDPTSAGCCCGSDTTCCTGNCSTLPALLNLTISGIAPAGCQLLDGVWNQAASATGLNALFNIYATTPPLDADAAWTGAIAFPDITLYTGTDCTGTPTDITPDPANNLIFVTCSDGNLTVDINIGWNEYPLQTHWHGTLTITEMGSAFTLTVSESPIFSNGIASLTVPPEP